MRDTITGNPAAPIVGKKTLPKAAGKPADAPHVEKMITLREAGWIHRKTKYGKVWHHPQTGRTAINSDEALKLHQATRKP